MPELNQVKTWLCPKCGKSIPRTEGINGNRCSCGAFMEAAVEYKDVHTGETVATLGLARLED